MRTNWFQDKNTSIFSYIIFYFWLIFISLVVATYFLKPEIFTPDFLKYLFEGNIFLGLFLYFILWTLRGFTLIPSTPLVLAAALVLPARPVFLITMICVSTSSSIVYFLWKYIWFDQYFHQKYPRQVSRLQNVLQEREIPIIAMRSFFPLVPTDMIVYASEAIDIKLWKCLVWVSIGEGIIWAIYIFWSQELVGWFI